ncbi:MAG: UDP-N-acetylmuramoyl-L-alanyl-D-glutamate--2,6-diaminopimelate ligase [Coriobacteriia bacterium]|nr:UDP-N-acetylmuramoyl-L-alanyl-D-glutamate--2,6-diaminopimelate ligase [Coriobacteriia bacterium]
MTIIRLADLLHGLEATYDGGDSAINVSGIAYRSDHVRPGDAFFCIPGLVHDGHDFAADAISRGAVAVVATRRPAGIEGVPVVLVADTRKALARCAAVLYGDPSRDMAVVGITGTNGKTTTTYLLENIARASGRKTGLIGTVETRIGTDRLVSDRTTPESADLQALLAEMRDSGVQTVAMEVSSHAVDLSRVEGVHFAVAAFTNLSQDHLDYHHTIEEYYSVKRRLFTELDVAERVVNIDSSYGAAIARDLESVLTVGRSDSADVRAVDEESSADGTRFALVTPIGAKRVELPLAAEYNVSNALVATGCALALGIDLTTIVEGLRSAPQVPGRLERIDCGQDFAVFVDYAHTPDSLAKAISAVRALTSGRVIAVFGCGGDRDSEKRPLMGEAAGEGAHHLILTSDNPRSEDPGRIITQIEDGVLKTGVSYEVIVDRKAAIRAALEQSAAGDAVLIAGKGHEDYQIFADRTIHFDDREAAREVLEGLCSHSR